MYIACSYSAHVIVSIIYANTVSFIENKLKITIIIIELLTKNAIHNCVYYIFCLW